MSEQEQISIESYQRFGRKPKRISEDNIHEVVFDLCFETYKYKDEFQYDFDAREHLKEVVNYLNSKGYSVTRSSKWVKEKVDELFEQLAGDGVSEEKGQELIKAIKEAQESEVKAQQEDIDKLQEAIDALGPDFWKRYQASKRQSIHKRQKRKKQISIELKLFEQLTRRKQNKTWDALLIEMKQNHDDLTRLMADANVA
ncbi:hypothetical protein [Alteromonas naphthalenivorans]|uniref:Uncharacterized protein n=1 Tax=Alteromonas naphthalenivorans TaxID=715451 RepID=F5ZF10_ALTNA|nr:hypothetical protein [Alteromonas naphthalenivorans]AEF04787.1 hypothetical protein ambt_16410 [Alteromonas naphthalenivorans]